MNSWIGSATTLALDVRNSATSEDSSLESMMHFRNKSVHTMDCNHLLVRKKERKKEERLERRDKRTLEIE